MEQKFMERFEALEHQCYLMYLQLNAVPQLLVDNGILLKEQIGTAMDGMHGEIEEAVKPEA
jgi:hypothetical protein